MANTIKSEQMRIVEAIDIRNQLRRLGVTMNEQARFKLMVASNEFIKTGFSCNLRLPIDEKARAVVHFRSSPSQQSGVILEYL